jgi:hypothetical protein
MLADLIGDVTTIDDVVATMSAIDAALADDDGVKWFNYLYLEVTEALQADQADQAAAWQDWPHSQSPRAQPPAPNTESGRRHHRRRLTTRSLISPPSTPPRISASSLPAA